MHAMEQSGNALNVTVQERVYQHIRGSILSGRLRQGQRIVERKIAEQMGSSRVPIREALLRLSSEGLLSSLPKWGFTVKEYTKDDIIELYQLREAIESKAVRLAVEKASEDEIREIILIHEKAVKLLQDEESGDNALYNKYDNEFHHAILRASGNKRFFCVFQPLHFEDMVVRLNCIDEELSEKAIAENRERTLREHKCLVDALVGRDGKKAEQLVRQHILGAIERIQRMRNDV